MHVDAGNFHADEADIIRKYRAFGEGFDLR
jgi:hypothetical protein